MSATHKAPRALPALVTPFTTSGEIDFESHRHNIRSLTAAGVRGFLVAGSTGEGPYLLAGERNRLLAAVRDESPESFLLCGVAAQSVAQAKEQLTELELADAPLVVTPTAFVSTEADQIRFYESVADFAELPIWLYTVPGVTGYNLPVTAVIELASHPNIVGIKDSSGIPDRIEEIRQGCGSGFLIYAGASRALAASRRAGCDGAITASCNYAFGLVDDLVGREATDPAIDAIQVRLNSLAGPVEAFGIPGTKAAATQSGLRAGAPRSPLTALSDNTAAELLTQINAVN